MWQSIILSSAERGQEALASVEKGIQINPYYGVTYIYALGRAYFTLGQDENAITHFNRGIVRNPNFIPNHVFKTLALESLGKIEEAEAAATVS